MTAITTRKPFDMITITRNMTVEQRRNAFVQLFNAIPDEPRGQRVETVAKFMCASISSVRIWSAPAAVKIPSAGKIALLAREAEKRGVLPDYIKTLFVWNPA